MTTKHIVYLYVDDMKNALPASITPKMIPPSTAPIGFPNPPSMAAANPLTATDQPIFGDTRKIGEAKIPAIAASPDPIPKLSAFILFKEIPMALAVS